MTTEELIRQRVIAVDIANRLEASKSNPPKDLVEASFDPPGVPVIGIISTLVIPAAIWVIPYFFDAAKDSTQSLIILALIVFAILLIALFLTTYFRLYNESFAYQVIRVKQSLIENRLDIAESLTLLQAKSALEIIDSELARREAANSTESQS